MPFKKILKTIRSSVDEKIMIRSGILNPALLSLLARVRHTNMLVIADRGFPSWPGLETIDLSLTDDIPTVLNVVRAIRDHCQFGNAYMASEFLAANPESVHAEFRDALNGISLQFEAHEEVFKTRVPKATGLIRTGDSTQYSNIILVSA